MIAIRVPTFRPSISSGMKVWKRIREVCGEYTRSKEIRACEGDSTQGMEMVEKMALALTTRRSNPSDSVRYSAGVTRCQIQR